MFQPMLRTALLVLLAILVAGPMDTFARGPGGGGGRGGKGGGARAGGARGGNQNALANQGRKKKSGPKVASGGPNLNAAGGNLNGSAQALSGNAQNLSGAIQKFQGAPGAEGALQNGALGADKFQSLQQQAGQKWQSRDGEHQQNAQQKWRSHSGDFQQNAQNAVSSFQNGPQPFTAEWYADHPAAWQYTHPHADAWAATTATGVAAWLGWAAYDANDNNGNGTAYYNTYVYDQVPADESEEAADESADDQSETDEAEADESTVAQSDTGEWLSLGVYSVLSSSGEPTSRMLQLNVNREGELRGVYYDAISNTSQNLSGNLDRATQLAQWTLDSNPQITFRAKLDELTQASGTIQVNQPAGGQQWRIARQENAS